MSSENLIGSQSGLSQEGHQVDNSKSTHLVLGHDVQANLDETIAEILILQSYSRSVGKVIPNNVLTDISELVNNDNSVGNLGAVLKLALSIHGNLSLLVAPVTVRSLKATNPNQGLISWLKEIWSIPLILVFTLAAFAGFVLESDLNRQTSSSHKNQQTDISGEIQ